MDPMYGHSRTRTTSSNVFPMQQPPQHPHHLQQPHMTSQHQRRSPSVNTFSTASSIPPPAAYRTSSTNDLRRSTSTRSGGAASIQATSYVALLRRQKATVWCDRAQHEDPRIAAQQKAAKMRANLEVVGRSSTGNRTNTMSGSGKIAGKMKRHGKNQNLGFAPGDHHVGVGGVPLRLSATEVEAESSDDDDQQNTSRTHHKRTGSSGRSSTASNRRALGYRTSGGAASFTNRRGSPGDTPERADSLVEEPAEYVGQHQPTDDAASGKARSTGSGSSAEKADNVGELGSAPRLASNSLLHSALTREKSVKNPEELRRRGSVDERTATLTSGRLFIANPD